MVRHCFLLLFLMLLVPARAELSEALEELLEESPPVVTTGGDSLDLYPKLRRLEGGGPEDNPRVLLADYEFHSTDQQREALWEACQGDPDLRVTAAWLLPRRQEVFEAVRDTKYRPLLRLWDVEDWLKYNTEQERAALLDSAREGAYWPLRALCALDPGAAEEVAAQLANSSEPIQRVRGVGILFYLRTEDAHRVHLESVLGDSPEVKYEAQRALVVAPWQGRDRSLEILLRDPGTPTPTEGFGNRHPVAELVREDMDRWIPVLVRLLNHDSRAVHNGAVDTLIQFQLGSARVDALRPLLPWLLDPSWSDSKERLRLIQSVADIGLTEAVPGLVQVVDTSNDSYERYYALEALLEFGELSLARPRLRRMLESPRGSKVFELCRLGLDHGLFTDLELRDGLGALLESDEKGERAPLFSVEMLEGKLEPDVVLGGLVARMGNPPPEVVAWAMDRLNPPLTPEQQSMLLRWKVEQVDLWLLDVLEAGRLDLEMLKEVLRRAPELKRRYSSRLRKLLDKSDERCGVAAALLADPGEYGNVLASLNSRSAFLSCARWMGLDIPVESVARFRRETAAMAYLLNNDSRAARAVLEKTEGYVITGRSGGGFRLEPTGIEREFLDKLMAEELDDVFVMMHDTFGIRGRAGITAIFVKGQKARLVDFERPQSRRERWLTRDEIERFRRFVKDRRVDDWTGLHERGRVSHPTYHTYLHLTSKSGRRVFADSPRWAGAKGAPFLELGAAFNELTAVAAPRILDIVENTPGARMVQQSLPGEHAVHLYEHNGVPFVGRLLRDDFEDRTYLWYEIRGDETVLSSEGPTWLIDDLGDLPQAWESDRSQLGIKWVAQLPDGSLLRRVSPGIAVCKAGKGKVVLSGNEFQFGDPVVSSDGRWAIIPKLKGAHWAEPNVVVRLDISSGKVYPVPIEAADTLEPLAYLDFHDAFLIQREKEYFLLEPDSGDYRPVSGEFRPWQSYALRPFQSTGQKHVVWGCLEDPASKETTLGHYDLRDFSFSPRYRLDGRYGHDDLLVDGDELYLIVKGDVVALPLAELRAARGD